MVMGGCNKIWVVVICRHSYHKFTWIYTHGVMNAAFPGVTPTRLHSINVEGICYEILLSYIALTIQTACLWQMNLIECSTLILKMLP